VLAYAAIALEHPLRINKSASALLGAGLLWTIYALASGDSKLVAADLNESLQGMAQIVFFLMGATTIVMVSLMKKLLGNRAKTGCFLPAPFKFPPPDSAGQSFRRFARLELAQKPAKKNRRSGFFFAITETGYSFWACMN
jgi:hypothetical protein